MAKLVPYWYLLYNCTTNPVRWTKIIKSKSTLKQGYGRDCDPGWYSHGIFLKMHEMVQGCWFQFMVCWFICSFRLIFSMGSCLHKGVLLGIRAYWNHSTKKRRRFIHHLLALLAFWANLPSSRNVNINPDPHHPIMLRSINHVSKFKER